MEIIKSIQNRIYEVRGERVMLDFDLAALYTVATKVLNQSVKRNIKRFPPDFMFQLTTDEWYNLRSQIVTSNVQNLDNQISNSVIQHGGNRYRPYVFTEQGVAMLSGVLSSDRAINMNISIMRAFVEIRKMLIERSDFKEQVRELRDRIGEHDAQLSQIYDALENLLDEKAEQKKWEERVRIGFRKNDL
jgi:phage regulator Rha-like protein